MGKSDDMGGKAKQRRDQAKEAQERGGQAGRKTEEELRQQAQRTQETGRRGGDQSEDLRDSVPDALNDASHREREDWDT